MKSLFRGVVLTFGDLIASELVCFVVYGFINATNKKHDQCLSTHLTDSVQRTTGWRKVKVNMAEGSSTTATPSNQFVVKCIVHGHHVYKHIWSPCIVESFETFCEDDNDHDTMAV